MPHATPPGTPISRRFPAVVSVPGWAPANAEVVEIAGSGLKRCFQAILFVVTSYAATSPVVTKSAAIAVDWRPVKLRPFAYSDDAFGIAFSVCRVFAPIT